jgi:hypothetical protein
MIISTAPIVAGNAPPADQRDGWGLAAFVGQVPVRIRGPVSAGDYIVASGLEDGTGIAVAPSALDAAQIGQIAGRALESADEVGVHQVNAMVGLPSKALLQDRLSQMERENQTMRAQLALLRTRQDEALAGLKQQNADLRIQLTDLQQRKNSELDDLRAELAMLRKLVAPRVAGARNR